MAKYIRKTRDLFDLDQHTAEGWECVTTEESFKEIKERRKEYRENQPGQYRIRKYRERI